MVTKVFAGFYFCRLFLYRLTFLPTIINADFFFTDKVNTSKMIVIIKPISQLSSGEVDGEEGDEELLTSH